MKSSVGLLLCGALLVPAFGAAHGLNADASAIFETGHGQGRAQRHDGHRRGDGRAYRNGHRHQRRHRHGHRQGHRQGHRPRPAYPYYPYYAPPAYYYHYHGYPSRHRRSHYW